MEFIKRELNHLALCLGRCNTCSESSTCKLKAKVQQTDDSEMDGIVYDALANYYSKIYLLAKQSWPSEAGEKEERNGNIRTES